MSPESQFPGSPHSSPCFTFGHGVDLYNNTQQKQLNIIVYNKWYKIVVDVPIFEFPRTSSLVLAIVILRAGVALSTQSWWSFARFSFVI